MTTPLPEDERFLDVARDVAHRFGSYGRYGSRAKAQKAQRRRAPGFDEQDYDDALDFFVELYAVAKRGVKVHHHPKGGTASFEDVDFDALLADLDELRPGFAVEQKGIIASWSVLYYVLM